MATAQAVLERYTADVDVAADVQQQAVKVDAKTGDMVFEAIAVDRKRTPNRKGFVFDWKRPADVDVTALRANPVLLYRHDYDSLPIGRIDKIDVSRDRVRMTCRIPDYPELEEIRRYIKDGLLRAVSIGFYIRESEEREVDGMQVLVVRKLELVELSVCVLGAHETALIQQATTRGNAKLSDAMAGFVWPDGATWQTSVDGADGADRGTLYRLTLPEPEPEGQAAGLADTGEVVITEADLVAACQEADGEAALADPDAAQAAAERFNCSCIKCGHKLTTDKHCADLKCPKCGGQMRRVERPGPGQDAQADAGATQPAGVDPEADPAGADAPADAQAAVEPDASDPEDLAPGWRAIPYGRHGDGPKLADKAPWDGPGQVAAAKVPDLKVMATLEDSDRLDVKGGYKLPHHQATGKNPVVWRGVAAAMGVLLGARGGVKGIGADAKKQAYEHLAKHYGQFDREAPKLQDYTPAELLGLHEGGWLIVPGAAEPHDQATDADRLDAVLARLEALELEVEQLRATDPTPADADQGTAASAPTAATGSPSDVPAEDLEGLRLAVRAILTADPRVKAMRDAFTTAALEDIRAANRRTRK